MPKKANKILRSCDIFYPKKIYKVIDVIKEQKYLFVGSYLEVDKIINKINEALNLKKDGMGAISADEKKKLSSKYNIVNLTTNIDSNTILIKDFINDDDTILTIKKKIMVFINPKSIPTKQHLWISKSKISNYEESKFGLDELLGVEYNNEEQTFNI